MACNNKKETKPTNKSIKSVFARTIYDSRGNPTVEVDLITDLGLFRASVPAGSDTGAIEAVELRDGVLSEHLGRGVTKAVENVNNIIGPELVKADMCVTEQEKIDQFMIDLDGTENKSKLGANAILGVSLAVCKAGAARRGIPLYRHIADLAGLKDLVLPVPVFNVLNGGVHAGNKLPLQEFMIIPTGANSFAEAMKMGAETFQNMKNIIMAKYGIDAAAAGEEGAFAPNLGATKDALLLINEAIGKAGYTGRIEIGIDAGASNFFKNGPYNLDFKNPKSDKKSWLTADKLYQTYQGFMKDFPIVSIEDPFHSEDWAAWIKMTADSSIQIVGDELTVSNPKRIQMAIDQQACNCVLLRINQIGTVTEAIKVHLLAKSNGWGTMISQRCGETEDTFIADLVVGLSTGQIKSGAPCRSDRTAKYNQIIRIEEELCTSARFAGRSFRKPL